MKNFNVSVWNTNAPETAIIDKWILSELPNVNDRIVIGDGEPSEENVHEIVSRIFFPGSSQVRLYITMDREEEILAPDADFTGDTETTVGSHASFTFSGAVAPDSSSTWSWKAALDGNPVSEFSTQQTTSGKFFPEVAGSYTISLTITNDGGTDTETKVSYLTVTEP